MGAKWYLSVVSILVSLIASVHFEAIEFYFFIGYLCKCVMSSEQNLHILLKLGSHLFCFSFRKTFSNAEVEFP